METTTLELINNLQHYMIISSVIFIILIILIITLFVQYKSLNTTINAEAEIMRRELKAFDRKADSLKMIVDHNEKEIEIKLGTLYDLTKINVESIKILETKVNETSDSISKSSFDTDKTVHDAKIARMNEIYQHLINDKYLITNSLFAVNEMVKILLQLISEDNEEEWDLTKKNIENILLFIDQKQLLKDFTDPHAIILANSGLKTETASPKVLERYGQE